MRLKLEEQWNQPLPQWTETIKEETAERIELSRFAKECRAGNKTVIQNLLKRFWPFVKQYPALIEVGVKNAKWHLFKRLKLRAWWDFRTTGVTMADIMCREEKQQHAELWLVMGQSVNVTLTDYFSQIPHADVRQIIAAFSQAPDPATFFFRVAAVEIFAEAASVHLLESDQLKDMLKHEGRAWLMAHAYHSKGMTHEALMYHLGFWFLQKEQAQYYANPIVQRIVNLFLETAEGAIN